MLGLLNAAAILLAAAGLAKLIRPGTGKPALVTAGVPGADRISGPLLNRASGALELLLALVAIIAGGRPAAVLITVVYVVLAGLSIRMMSLSSGKTAPDCGCFGSSSQLTHWHTTVNGGFALIGLAAIGWPPDRLDTQPAGTALVLLLASITLAYLGFLLMTVLPELLGAAAPLEVSR
jgi:hypothetical protein